jgi:hypothetical protein
MVENTFTGDYRKRKQRGKALFKEEMAENLQALVKAAIQRFKKPRKS